MPSLFPVCHNFNSLYMCASVASHNATLPNIDVDDDKFQNTRSRTIYPQGLPPTALCEIYSWYKLVGHLRVQTSWSLISQVTVTFSEALLAACQSPSLSWVLEWGHSEKKPSQPMLMSSEHSTMVNSGLTWQYSFNCVSPSVGHCEQQLLQYMM